MAVTTEDVQAGLVDAWARAFTAYAASPDEGSLTGAYDLGREALTNGLGVLQTVEVCTQVLTAAMVHAATDAERRRLAAAANRFFIELVSPYEMTHRVFRDANTVLRRLNDALETQCRQIANALHDEAAQLLVPVHLGLAEVARHSSPHTARTLTELRCLLDEVEERLRRFAHDLRPPELEDFGLDMALKVLVSNLTARWNLPVTLRLELGTPLPPTIEATVYRIAQESLTNVVRHAGATQAWLTVVHASGFIQCSVRDDGVGLNGHGRPRTSRGLGLAGLRERVAALGGRVDIGPGDGDRGTLVVADIPLQS